MHKKILILAMMMLSLFPVSVQAEEDIHIEITETGIKKTPIDDILSLKLVPGDKRAYTLQLKNKSRKKQRLYLKLSAEDVLLAEQLELQVLQDDHVLYDGTMQDAQTGVDLGAYSPDEKDSIQMMISLPEYADNPYSMQQSSICMEFTAQIIESINTGDQTRLVLFSIAIVLTSTLLLSMIKRRRKKS